MCVCVCVCVCLSGVGRVKSRCACHVLFGMKITDFWIIFLGTLRSVRALFVVCIACVLLRVCACLAFDVCVFV